MTAQRSSGHVKLSTVSIALLLSGAGLAALAPPALAATTWTVCPGGSCSFTTIQAALAASSDGDTIMVEPGSYAGPLMITTSVILCSTTPGGFGCDPQTEDTIVSGGGLYPVYVDADFVTVQGFTIENPAEASVDSTFGPVDPSLVAVYGDDVTIVDNILQSPAAAPLPGQTRWYTVGVNVGTGSDRIEVSHNTIRDFVPAVGPGGVCPQAPCKVVGILNWGEGSGFRAEDNLIDLSGTSLPAAGIDFNANGIAHIYDNDITMPGSPPGSDPVSVGIDAGIADQAQIFGNTIRPALGETPFGLYGIYGIFHRSEIDGNRIHDAQHGIMLRSSSVGENEVRGNFFLNGNQGVLNFARDTFFENNHFSNVARGLVLDRVPGDPTASTDIVLFGNDFDQTPTTILLTDTVEGVSVDARRNDWGFYRRDLIEATIDDASGTNTVDVSCFIDEDGVTQVCPDAGFTWNVLNTGWPRQVELTDTSFSNGRSIENVTWVLPDGSFAHTPTVTILRDPGSGTVEIIVRDTEGFEDRYSDVIATPNSAPVMAVPATLTAVEGTTLALTLGATDAEGDTLAYAMTGAPAGAALDAASGALSWAVPYDADGSSFVVTFSASDGVETTTGTTTISVVDTPVGPVFAPIAPRSVVEGNSLTAIVRASDPDGGSVTLTPGTLPAGATFVDHGDGSGTFAWTPPDGATGAYAIDITATATNAMATTATLPVNVVREVAFSLTRTGPAGILLVSPGQTLHLVAALANAGSSSDTYTLTASDTSGWGATPAGPTTVAAGSAENVEAVLTVPANGGTTAVTLRACSDAAPAICRSATWVVKTPILVAIDMNASFALGETVTGVVRTTWLDGAPAAGVDVSLVRRAAVRHTLTDSRLEGATDATGAFAFEFDDLPSKTPGLHLLAVGARKGLAAEGAAQREFRVIV